MAARGISTGPREGYSCRRSENEAIGKVRVGGEERIVPLQQESSGVFGG